MLSTLKRIKYLLRLLALLPLLPVTMLRAQSQTYTPVQIERLIKLSELYGHIKFFHPYLGYKKINWDSAYAQSAPLVAHATTDEEAADALRRLLAVLGDEATTVRLTGAKVACTTAADSLQVFWAADSTLVLKTNAYAGADNNEAAITKVNQFIQKLPRARALLLDLRGSRPLTVEQVSGFSYALYYPRLNRYLSAQPSVTPAKRFRGHNGFSSEEGGSSGDYYSYFYTRLGETVQPYKAARSRHTVILVNENSVLPGNLYALRNQPQVRLFGTGAPTDARLVPTAQFSFSKTITVEFRTGELVNADGSIGLQGLVSIPATVRPEAVESYVLANLRSPKPAASAQLSVSTFSTPPPTVYPSQPYPTLGYRLLAGAKMWAVIHYFHAYRDLWPDSWDAALRPALTELAAASDASAYALAVSHFYRHLQDGHAVVSSRTIREYIGTGGLAAEIKFIANKPVISRVYGDSLLAKGLQVGDVLTAVNGEPVAVRVARLGAILAASNEWARLAYISERLLRSPVGTPIKMELLGANNHPKTVTLISQPTSRLQPRLDITAVYRVLPGNIGYADLNRLDSEDTDKMLEALKDTKALIFDMRGYPHGTAWTIAPRLTERQQLPAACFVRYTPTRPSISGEDGLVTEKMFFTQAIPAGNKKPVYKGQTVMLVDERTQSQAEHTGLFFEVANGTEFIGSPTAGADGDVTSFTIPGAIMLSFSGQEVRHVDGRQLQQVGLQPKIVVRPTLKGLRQGQDEVLARAVKYLNTGK